MPIDPRLLQYLAKSIQQRGMSPGGWGQQFRPGMGRNPFSRGIPPGPVGIPGANQVLPGIGGQVGSNVRSPMPPMNPGMPGMAYAGGSPTFNESAPQMGQRMGPQGGAAGMGMGMGQMMPQYAPPQQMNPAAGGQALGGALAGLMGAVPQGMPAPQQQYMPGPASQGAGGWGSMPASGGSQMPNPVGQADIAQIIARMTGNGSGPQY